MKYVTLGKTGLEISRMGFGGIPIQRTDVAAVKELVKAMVEAGVTYIDSARGYTVSEEFLGEALEGYRDKFVLATKSMARTKEAMAADIEVSLKNFRTDYIDLYQIHNPSPADFDKVQQEGGALEALMEAKAAGKIGHLGITLHSLDLFKKALDLPWVETIMYPYNIVETQAEELIAECAKRGIGFIAMKPLAGGAIDNGSLAMRFIAQNPNVTVVIPGMATLDELAQNLAAMEDESALTEDELAGIKKYKDELGTNFCRRCNYCAPCTVGIGIPAVFLMEGYYSRYGLQDWAKERYNAMPVKAKDCIGCGVCETRCPYDLPIREMLKRASAIMDN
ncbi:MAG: aldo/keto reductase [Lachnospiraceae bacterium]|nr:aldo/keto reductase [Lachnospiraceae bacterium]